VNRNIIIIILLMAFITYITRFPMLLISSRTKIPAWIWRGLKLVPIGVFTSLTIPRLVFHLKNGGWSPEYLVAGMVAFAVGLWKRQIVFSLISGVIFLIVYRYITGQLI
jgi:branched-subunit amino acid transport protein